MVMSSARMLRSQYLGYFEICYFWVIGSWRGQRTTPL